MVLARALASARMGEQVILLVPEQFSFEAEKAVFTSLSGSDALRINVLTFSRLAENIFRSYGGVAHKRLTDTARLVLMKIALREAGDSMTVYRRQIGRTSFVATMLETVEELKYSGTSPQALARTAEVIKDRVLAAKLRDITQAYEIYQAIVERKYTDPLDDIVKAARLVREHGYFLQTSIFIDGFDFFSPPERQLVELMLIQGWQLTVALCADALEQRGETDIFFSQKKTALRLIQFAKEQGQKVQAPVVLEENLRTDVPVIKEVETLLSEGEAQPLKDLKGLWCISCQDRYAEARFTAAEIQRLVREEGLRYRDIAVVCRSIADYQRPLEAALSEYSIPVFYDRKESVLTKPIAAILTAALEAVRGSYKTEAILQVARCPASGISSQRAARLENYCYVWSVDGKDWEQAFCNNPRGLTGDFPENYQEELDEIEKTRCDVMEPLITLKSRLAGCDGRGFALGLYHYLEGIDAMAHLRQYFGTAYPGDFTQAQQNDALWELVVDILDLFAESLEKVRYPLAVFVELFQMALGCLELGSIPNTIDQVIVAAADRMRLSSPKVVFVLGVNEGVFPALYQSHGVFTDQERVALVRSGIELSNLTGEWALLERFYLYRALCASRKVLYITWAASHLRGNYMQPSFTISQLKRLYPSVFYEEKNLPSIFFVADMATARSCYAQLCKCHSQEAATLRRLLELEGEENFAQCLERVGKDESAQGILPETARRLLGRQVYLSPTRIENFYRCPYAFLCDHLLGLRPRRRVEYTPLESGTAIHYVLELLLKEVGSAGISKLPDAELWAKVKGLLEQYICQMVSDASQLASRFRYQFQRLVLVLFTIIRHIGEDFNQSLFTAAGMEVPVGPKGKVQSQPLTAADGTPIFLGGKIDRIDIFRRGNLGNYVRVIDYKSGGKDFRLEEVFHGLNMQMLVYLFTVCDDPSQPFGPVRPAGILYMPGKLSAAEVPPSMDEETVKETVAASLRMKGLLLDDQAVLRAMEQKLEGRYIPAKHKKGSDELDAYSHVKTEDEFQKIRKVVYKNIREMANCLLRGEVAPVPVRGGGLNPCSYCSYGLMCNNQDTDLFRDLNKNPLKGEEEKKYG